MGFIGGLNSTEVKIASPNTTPLIVNPTATLANTEYSYALPANTKKFLIRSRSYGNLRFGYLTGIMSGSSYLSIFKGSNFVDDNFYLAQTIFFSSDKAGDILEIVTWV